MRIIRNSLAHQLIEKVFAEPVVDIEVASLLSRAVVGPMIACGALTATINHANFSFAYRVDLSKITLID